MKCNQYFSWWCSTPIKAGPWSWIHASVHKENHSSLTASTAFTAFTASTASTHCVLHGVAYCMGVHFTVWPFCTNGGDLFALRTLSLPPYTYIYYVLFGSVLFGVGSPPPIFTAWTPFPAWVTFLCTKSTIPSTMYLHLLQFTAWVSIPCMDPTTTMYLH